ncbi:hypothetical protein EGX94_07100 [Propionibacterium acidifaciens]|nr:hypothetical protein EGX94_07100 [Propionibacterium acidifaciens]
MPRNGPRTGGGARNGASQCSRWPAPRRTLRRPVLGCPASVLPAPLEAARAWWRPGRQGQDVRAPPAGPAPARRGPVAPRPRPPRPPPSSTPA